MTTPEQLEPVYYCLHCGWETKFEHFRIRERLRQDHTDPFECISHLKSKMDDVISSLPSRYED